VTDGSDDHLRDEVDYANVVERREYREIRGYPRNARPYSRQQTTRRLADLVEVAARCARIVERGEAAFFADDTDGELLRAAAERYLITIGNVVEKLHSDYKDAFPGVPWRAVTGIRNLVAHHYDKVDLQVVWRSIVHRVPELIHALGLTDGVDDCVVPVHLHSTPEPPPEPFPGPSSS
jgi:uncharacterized protein with HEPN domain